MIDELAIIAKRDPKRTAPRFASFEEDVSQYFIFVEDFALT